MSYPAYIQCCLGFYLVFYSQEIQDMSHLSVAGTHSEVRFVGRTSWGSCLRNLLLILTKYSTFFWKICLWRFLSASTRFCHICVLIFPLSGICYTVLLGIWILHESCLIYNTDAPYILMTAWRMILSWKYDFLLLFLSVFIITLQIILRLAFPPGDFLNTAFFIDHST